MVSSRLAGEVLRCVECRGANKVFVAMAHDYLLDWVVTRPPPAQTSVDFLLFLTNLCCLACGPSCQGERGESSPIDAYS